MTRSIVFVGEKERDLLYYFVSLLSGRGEHVLVITVDKELKIGPHIRTETVDWLYCKDIPVEENSIVLSTYSYVLYELCESSDLNRGIEQKIKTFPCVIATDLTLEKGEWVAGIVNGWNNKCIVVLRDICSKRFCASYFRMRYPECAQKSDMLEVWLDSYNTYYAQCIDFLCQVKFSKLSSDMKLALKNLLVTFTELTMKQINEAIKGLRKGGMV